MALDHESGERSLEPEPQKRKNMASKIFAPTKEVFISIISKSRTIPEALEKLGLRSHTTNKEQLFKRANIENVSLVHLAFRSKRSKLWKISSEELDNVISSSYSFSEVLNKLGLPARGANFKTLYARLSGETISVAHFWKKKRTSNVGEIINLLVKGSNRINRLREKLVEAKLMDNICVWCGISDRYNGKPISLHVDHIDGDPTNNELNNLRILCPNCHSQTKTFGSKNNRRNKVIFLEPVFVNIVKKTKNCISCGGLISSGSTSGSCRKCVNPSRYPGLQTVLNDLRGSSFLAVGKKYGVSDNAVRKWLIADGIDSKEFKRLKIKKNAPVAQLVEHLPCK